jgi:hypothetical protein
VAIDLQQRHFLTGRRLHQADGGVTTSRDAECRMTPPLASAPAIFGGPAHIRSIVCTGSAEFINPAGVIVY